MINTTSSFFQISKKERKQIHYTYISFLNIPTEAEEEALTHFVEQRATVFGNPRYPKKKLGDIEYLTGTRVYRVYNITQHILRLLSLFGRQIKCVYDDQPEDTDNTEEIAENNNDPPETTDDDSDMHSQPQTDNEQNKNHNTDIDNNHTMNNSYEHSKQTSKAFQNLQPKRQELLKNQENITTRKTRPTRKQNTSNNEEYWIDNIPPELTEANYPPIINSGKQSKPDLDKQQEITVIQETPFSQLPKEQTIL